MKTYTVETWEKVKEAFKLIEQDRVMLADKLNLHPSPSGVLYRGHGSSEWNLKTTLERTCEEPVLVTEYYRHILKTRPQVEAFSNTRWDLMELEDYGEWAQSRSDLNWPDYPGYEYMIYLRHHGFPSPLLDWSQSPYVAAFFAYSNIPHESENIAIYGYADSIGPGKGWSSNEPLITVKGPYARSHKRHFLQQCKYTVCSKISDSRLEYASHEEVFNLEKEEQDVLWKIIAPRSLASSALKDLDTMNVNALSLMGSEDALIQTLGAREYIYNHA